MGALKVIVAFAGILLLQLSAFASAQKSNHTWLTLNGSPPLVIARGGFSGLLPDSSGYAYELAISVSVPDVVLWCDVQLTNDGVGICFPYIKLDNSSDISSLFPNRVNKYVVNGVEQQGYFPIDFTLKELSSVSLYQGIYSRSPILDGAFLIETVDDVVMQHRPATGLWLNVQYDIFYNQHNLSMKSFVVNASESLNISYISSPEVNFLRELAISFASNKTKLVFRFLDKNSTEPSTNQTYGSLLKNLTMIKTFAAGILVPKAYIWPLDETMYLLPHTSLVADAHEIGLQVFASDFANDVLFAYNYSYNPVAEYLSFIDNGNFSVDGVLSDFPITASEARECFANIGSNNASTKDKPLIISHLGASGDFPACSDLAYIQAIEDGADVIDCPVQLSMDGIPFCLNTEVSQSQVRHRNSTATYVAKNHKILASSMTWAEIQQDLTPEISSPYSESLLYRNPKFKNSGKIVSLAHFLELAINWTSLSGVLIKVENAKYLAENKGLNIIDAVLDALDNAGYNRYSAKQVMIASTSSSILKAMMGRRYELVYVIDEIIWGAHNDTIEYIKRFADSVVLNEKSILPFGDYGFLTNMTEVVSQFHSHGLPVYVEALKNEFVSQPFDMFSDPIVEINTYVKAAEVDGVITDFPKTAAAYRKNRCLEIMDVPTFMQPVSPGALLQALNMSVMPPAASLLSVNDVDEPPLNAAKVPRPPKAECPKTSPNNLLQIFSSLLISIMAIIVV